MKKKILVINPGSTSTKVALYEDQDCVAKESIRMDMEFVQKTDRIVEQLDVRTAQVQAFLDAQNLAVTDLDIIAARGGMLPACEGGAWAVNQLMEDVLTNFSLGQHASNLACMIGRRLTAGTDVPVIVYDPLTVDEMSEIAHMTGLPNVRFVPVVHVLNSRKVSRDAAAKLGIRYEDGNFIVAHLGGGVSVTAHEKGKLVDFTSTSTGPMSPERVGTLPTAEVIKLCFSGKYTQGELMKLMVGKGGFVAWLGTSDALEVERRIKDGDELAAKVYAAMSYQVAKAIGEMFAAMSSRVDAIIFTGALANSHMMVDPIIERVKNMGHIELLPGEREMDALAEGAMRVLTGQETAKEYTLLPPQFRTPQEMYAYLAQ